MNVVIINRSALSFSPYHEWLGGPGRKLFYLTASSKLDLPADRLRSALTSYAEVRRYDDFDTDAVELDVLDIAAEHGVDSIVAMSELDLVRAARLREHLSLAGQTVPSALAYRDKLLMKQRLAEHGIAVAAFRDVESIIDVIEFVEAHGFPVVVKPRTGLASQGITVLRGDDDLRRFALVALSPRVELVPRLLVEQFVEGDLYHVDGLVAGGEPKVCWPSRYIVGRSGYLAFTSGVPTGSCMLSADNPLTPRLIAFVRDVLAAMPTPELTTFHAEVFHTPDDRLVLGEIASRTGGGRINDSIRTGFGISLNETWVKAVALGADFDPRRIPVVSAPDRLAGFIVVFALPGTVLRVPAALPFDWVVDYRTPIVAGATVRETTLSDFVATFLVAGATEDEVLDRLETATAWLLPEIETAGADGAPVVYPSASEAGVFRRVGAAS